MAASSRRAVLLLGCALAALALAPAGCRRTGSTSGAPAAAGSDAAPRLPSLCDGPGCMPGFRVRTIDDTWMESAELAGRVTLILFSATWCEVCTKDGPGIEAVYRARQGRGFTLIGFARDGDDAGLRRYREQAGVTYPIVRQDADVFAAFGSPSQIPAFLLYGRDGRIRWRMTGALPAAVLEREVDLALAEAGGDAGAGPVRRRAVVVLGTLADPAHLAGALAAERARQPTLVYLVGDEVGPVEPRVVNALHLDAWATSRHVAGVVAPQAEKDERAYVISTVSGLRVAAVAPGPRAAMAAAAAAARADGAADLVIALAPPGGAGDLGADASVRAPAGAAAYRRVLTVDAHGAVTLGAEEPLDVAAATPDPAIEALSHP